MAKDPRWPGIWDKDNDSYRVPKRNTQPNLVRCIHCGHRYETVFYNYKVESCPNCHQDPFK